MSASPGQDSKPALPQLICLYLGAGDLNSGLHKLMANTAKWATSQTQSSIFNRKHPQFKTWNINLQLIFTMYLNLTRYYVDCYSWHYSCLPYNLLQECITFNLWLRKWVLRSFTATQNPESRAQALLLDQDMVLLCSPNWLQSLNLLLCSAPSSWVFQCYL